MRILLPLLLAVCAFSAPRAASANVVVTIQSAMGTFELELFDAVAPLTVANFLAYTDPVVIDPNLPSYDQSFIHRSVPGFVIQGGGFRLIIPNLLPLAVSPPTVPNEPGLSNVRGTVAMAKLDGNPNSATTQWFVNVGNNTGLDTINGGFTVFADVISGMSVADAISVLPRVNLGDDTPYTELPLRNWTSPNPIQPQNMVVLSSVARRTTPLCGDLNADSAINAVDVARLRSALANPSGSALTPGEAARCSVVGNATDCNVLDSTTVRRRLAGRTPHRLQICTAAL